VNGSLADGRRLWAAVQLLVSDLGARLTMARHAVNSGNKRYISIFLLQLVFRFRDDIHLREIGTVSRGRSIRVIGLWYPRSKRKDAPSKPYFLHEVGIDKCG